MPPDWVLDCPTYQPDPRGHMKKLAALILLTLTTSAFSCADLVGEYVCFDEYSYRQYRNISISEQENGLIVKEEGHNRYNGVLRVNAGKFSRENTKIQASCSGKTLKVTMSMGRYSETETIKKTKSGIIFNTKEETGSKRLNCTSK